MTGINEDDMEGIEILRKDMLLAVENRFFVKNGYLTVNMKNYAENYLNILKITMAVNDAELFEYLIVYLVKHPEFMEYIKEPLFKVQEQMKRVKNQLPKNNNHECN